MEKIKYFVFCISGYSRVGKDEFTNAIVERHGATKIGMTDLPRRHMMETYGFTKEQVFGPSELRNRGDLKHPKPSFNRLQLQKWDAGHDEKYGKKFGSGWYFCTASSDAFHAEALKSEHLFSDRKYIAEYAKMRFEDPRHRGFFFMIREEDPVFWVSPREALQLHCMLHQDLYEPVWVQKFTQTHQGWFATLKSESSNPNSDSRILYSNLFDYDQALGFIESPRYWVGEPIVACTDLRWEHDIRYVREKAREIGYTPVIVRVKRSSVPAPPFQHPSERGLLGMPDSSFDFVVNNDSTLEALRNAADSICRTVTSDSYVPKF